MMSHDQGVSDEEHEDPDLRRGVAGTALAYWLRRHGFTPTVVERAPAMREGGYKIDIRGAAVDVIDRMGLLADVRATRTEIRRASFVNSAGKPVASMDGDLFGGRVDSDIEVMRDDLARLVYDRTKDDVEYIFGDSVSAVSEDADGIPVTFENSEPRTFDLLVGADGLHSTVRALAFGDESRFVRHLGHYVSIFSVPNTLGLDREEMTYPLPGRTALVYSTRQDSAAKGAVPVRLATPGPRPPRHRRTEEAAGRRVRRCRMGGSPTAESAAQRPRLLLRLN